MIVVIDYGLGNVGALENSYRRIGASVKFARSQKDLLEAKKLILPGVGSFDGAMSSFLDSGLAETVLKLVNESGVPILGICVGMQMLASNSEEGTSKGLNLIKGCVRKIEFSSERKLPIPHMGWNNIKVPSASPLFKGLESESQFYFLHSYYFDAESSSDVLAYASYGDRFPCAVRAQNIYGVQFHPEKSHHWGEALLKNFMEL